jgi:hypothetical protein
MLVLALRAWPAVIEDSGGGGAPPAELLGEAILAVFLVFACGAGPGGDHEDDEGGTKHHGASS